MSAACGEDDMHLFLTGEIQVGKSTAIKRFLRASGAVACGFRTFWDGGALKIAPYGAAPSAGETVALKGEKGLTVLPHAFDAASERLFDVPEGADLMIMDELGFLESADPMFQRRVLDSLELPITVLGVIKPAGNAFLDKVRAHPRVRTVLVTPGNREEVYQMLCRELGSAYGIRL